MNTSNDKIDQLFQQKLVKVEKTPRPQAWEKLASRLAEKDKPVIPVWRKWAVAASIVLLLSMGGIGYFNLKNENIKSVELANIGKKPNIITKQPALKNNKKPQLLPNETVVVKEALANNTNNNATNYKTNVSKNKFSLVKKVEKLNNFENAQLNQPEIAHNNVIQEDFTNNKKIELPKFAIENNNIAVVENKVIDTDKSNTKPEDLTIVLTLNDYVIIEPKTEKLEEKKAPFFSRIFQQLKNAKNGERVDWNEIGFKPAKLLARAETKLSKTQ